MFWHGHTPCNLYKVPKTNTEWWKEKIERNKARDYKKVWNYAKWDGM